MEFEKKDQNQAVREFFKFIVLTKKVLHSLSSVFNQLFTKMPYQEVREISLMSGNSEGWQKVKLKELFVFFRVSVYQLWYLDLFISK